MSGWDESLVDPTRSPADALIIRSPGGRTGNLSLENGQVLSFPWKRQQQVAGTRAGNIKVYDDASTEYLNIQAPTLVPGGDLAYLYLAGWDDGTASIFMDNGGGQNFALASGIFSFDGGKAFFNDGIDVAGGFSDFRSDAGEDIQLISGGKIRLEAVEEIRLTGDAGIVIVNDATTGTDITVQTNRDLLWNVDRDCLLTCTLGDFSVNTGDAINLLADGIWLGEGSSATLQALSGGDVNLTATGIGGNINITAVDNVYLTSSGGAAFVSGSDVSLIVAAGTLSAQTVMSDWPAYSPTLTQGGTVTKTNTRSDYKKIGRTVTWSFLISATAAGTGGSAVKLTLPATAAASSNHAVGSGYIYDGASNVPVICVIDTTTTVAFVVAAGYYSVALASGHAVTGTIVYEAAS